MGPKYWAEDAIAVMDAVGSDQATIFGSGFTAMTGLAVAADYPERVRSMVIVNGAARVVWAPDYEAGAELGIVDPIRTIMTDPDAVEQGFDVLELTARAWRATMRSAPGGTLQGTGRRRRAWRMRSVRC